MDAQMIAVMVAGGAGLGVVVWVLAKIGQVLIKVAEALAAAAAVLFAGWLVIKAVMWALRQALTRWRTSLTVLAVAGWWRVHAWFIHYVAMDTRHRDRTRKRDGGVWGWAGQPATVYCRISKARDEDQTGVDRQERLCREVAERLGLVIVPGCVFVDNNRSAWRRNRTRPGWDALLAAIRAGRVRHVIVYHPDRLMRQPRDLEELLTVSEEHDITLHGQANRRDLSDPDDRFFLRIEVAHSCRSSDDTSRRLRDALEDRARAGRPHASARRAYGYAPGGMVIVEREAQIVREIFARYLDGASPGQIAGGLNERGIPTAEGCRWMPESVHAVISSRHVTGIRVFRGQDFGDGDWPAIIDRGTWTEAQDRRAYRASAYRTRPCRFYVLRGLVMCKRCARPMGGAMNNHKPYYACTRRKDRLGSACIRRIYAPKLEQFVTDAAIELLTGLDVTGTPTATLALPETDQAAISADEAELAELKDMWDHFGDDLAGADALELLAAAPDPASAARLPIKQISTALGRARRRQVADKAQAIATALRTEQLRQPEVVTAAYAATVRAQAAILTTLQVQIKSLQGQVEAHFGRHPDAEIYLSQPGLGPILGARVLGEFGDDPHRYTGARARKNYAGTSPITRQSGKKKTVHARHVHNDRLLDALGGQAQSALIASPGARAYYDQQRHRGLGHRAALRQLANRLVGILHGCLKTRTCYDEATAWPTTNKDQQIAA